MMSGMSGGSMLRTRRKDANVKPNRRLDRKSSRGMLYENEELRLRTININAEVERGQSDIKKLKRENEQLRREVGALRGEYDRLERLLKDRHQQDNSDAEGSGSCCSDCESECCNVQNNVNAACDVKKKSDAPCRDTKAVSIRENEGSCSMETCGLPTCGKLTAVPEESILRVPYSQNTPPCNCQCVKPENIGFVESVSPVRDYYTAVVTVPMPSHLPEHQNIQLTPSIYPKTGLDILINNNNAFEKFEGFTMSPPIGFIIPSTSNCDSYDKDSYQIVPNIDMNSDSLMNMNQINVQENQDTQFNSIESGNDISGLFNGLETVCNKNGEDSYFVCNTKKIIQQMTVQNTNVLSTTNLTTCNCNSNKNAVNNPDIIIVSSNSEIADKPSFITEKNIELNYDYPKPIITSENPEKPVLQPIKIEEVKTQDITQTTHTTTEVNSTVIFSRKNPIFRDKSKHNMFMRSNSAPVEPIDREPIYATVQKLPKKLTRLNIKKLENEIKYIPPEDEDVEETPKTPINANNTQSILKSSDPESPDCTLKSNGVLPKLKVKIDSFSESSDKNDNNRSSVPKSPVVRKKKRFSIHFKRKSNKKPIDKKPAEVPEVKDVKSDEIKNGVNKGDSDRLLEQSSSIESPDISKFKDSSPTFVCKKHKKQRHTSRHDLSKQRQSPSYYDHQHAHQCDKCSRHRRHSVKRCEHVKNNCSPVRNYFKNDSYQEITTSHSERERTNSLSSSGHSGFSLATNKSRKMSSSHQDENIPWCGCWGNSCL